MALLKIRQCELDIPVLGQATPALNKLRPCFRIAPLMHEKFCERKVTFAFVGVLLESFAKLGLCLPVIQALRQGEGISNPGVCVVRFYIDGPFHFVPCLLRSMEEQERFPAVKMGETYKRRYAASGLILDSGFLVSTLQVELVGMAHDGAEPNYPVGPNADNQQENEADHTAAEFQGAF